MKSSELWIEASCELEGATNTSELES